MMKAKRPSKARRLSSNIISTLPQTIIETILCLLPIDEAARTSILSREWRYKWTTIPKLEFRDSTYFRRATEPKQTSGIARAREDMDWRCKLFYAIHQVLLLHQGPIHEFTLIMEANWEGFEIDQIILHLSRNHAVKKLSLELDIEYFYKLPLSAFSLHQLTDLHLRNVDLDHKPTFSGFGSLRSLYLNYVMISTKALLHLLSNSPSLKSLTLKNLTLLVHEPGDREICTTIELLKCLPAIEHFTTSGRDLPWEALDSIPKELPTSLIHLKHIRLREVCFVDGYGLTFLAVLIKCSPNLEKIRVQIDIEHTSCYEYGICSDVLEEYSNVWLEHLYELEISSFCNMKPELEFVKFILARSPKLKKVSIHLHHTCRKGRELKLLKVLLRAPRASPVEIVVE